jgi:hypothetical protein
METCVNFAATLWFPRLQLSFSYPRELLTPSDGLCPRTASPRKCVCQFVPLKHLHVTILHFFNKMERRSQVHKSINLWKFLDSVYFKTRGKQRAVLNN